MVPGCQKKELVSRHQPTLLKKLLWDIQGQNLCWSKCDPVRNSKLSPGKCFPERNTFSKLLCAKKLQHGSCNLQPGYAALDPIFQMNEDASHLCRTCVCENDSK
ncbi:uncharacterized protein LOC128245554 [Mya arenaria]|uniref:uncharacterized protein LOC128245554 n=1 Tax=Mya arenaria TaxID=6604 RepID=UPI0022E88F80|nr:uncharacterized protein LOC128245554 [Mya arenaria]